MRGRGQRVNRDHVGIHKPEPDRGLNLTPGGFNFAHPDKARLDTPIHDFCIRTDPLKGQSRGLRAPPGVPILVSFPTSRQASRATAESALSWQDPGAGPRGAGYTAKWLRPSIPREAIPKRNLPRRRRVVKNPSPGAPLQRRRPLPKLLSRFPAAWNGRAACSWRH